MRGSEDDDADVLGRGQLGAGRLELAPHLERVAEQFAGRARVVKLDIDENHKTAAMYGVRSIPTLLVFKRGEPVDKLVGNPGSARPLEQLVARNLDERAAAR